MIHVPLSLAGVRLWHTYSTTPGPIGRLLNPLKPAKPLTKNKLYGMNVVYLYVPLNKLDRIRLHLNEMTIAVQHVMCLNSSTVWLHHCWDGRTCSEFVWTESSAFFIVKQRLSGEGLNPRLYVLNLCDTTGKHKYTHTDIETRTR